MPMELSTFQTLQGAKITTKGDDKTTCNGDISDIENHANIHCWFLPLLYTKEVSKVDSSIDIAVLVKNM